MDFNVREKTLTTTASASKSSSRVSSLLRMFPPPHFLQGVQFENYQKWNGCIIGNGAYMSNPLKGIQNISEVVQQPKSMKSHFQIVHTVELLFRKRLTNNVYKCSRI